MWKNGLDRLFFFDIIVLQCNTKEYMRCVVTISLPEDMCQEVEKQMKEHRFANKSEFIRHVLRFWIDNKKDK